MEIIVKNNRTIFEEEDYEMCQTLEDILDKKIARENAILQNRLNTLNIKLAESGRIDDIIKAAKDISYQSKLFEEFGL